MSLSDIIKEPIIKPEYFLPLREPTFFILMSIAEGQKHGYAILQDVESLSAGKIKLSNGTLYGALTRLQDQDLIERVPSLEPAVKGKPRKAYQLTETGLRILKAEIDRMDALVQTARRQLPGGAQ